MNFEGAQPLFFGHFSLPAFAVPVLSAPVSESGHKMLWETQDSATYLRTKVHNRL